MWYSGDGGDDDDNVNLKTYQGCKVANYCSRDCQRSHFSMRGPFGHKNSSAKTLLIKQDRKVYIINIITTFQY
jgi:hypothetical protein